jgi:hypothetical protein
MNLQRPDPDKPEPSCIKYGTGNSVYVFAETSIIVMSFWRKPESRGGALRTYRPGFSASGGLE